LLENNIEDKRISTTLKLTPATITRLKMWINLNKDGFNLVFKKLDKKDKEDMVKQILYRFLNYAIKAAFGRIPKPF